MKKNKKQDSRSFVINRPQESKEITGQISGEPGNLVFLLNWLMGVLLFFLLYNVATPFLLGSIDKYNPITGITANNLIFGICGLFIYFIEPLVHYSFVYQQKKVEGNDEPKPDASIINDLLWYIQLFLLDMPYAVLVWIKPVIRAFILFESFSLLNLGGGESAPFVIIVMADIFLYYSNLLFPNWTHSPSKIIARAKWFTKPAVNIAGSVISIFFTAIICNAFAYGAYQQAGDAKNKSEQLIILLFFWYLVTLYVRMDYLQANIDNLYESIKSMPRRSLLLSILILVISFTGFMWRYFFGWW